MHLLKRTMLAADVNILKIQAKGVLGAAHAACHEQSKTEAYRAYLGISLCLSLCSWGFLRLDSSIFSSRWQSIKM